MVEKVRLTVVYNNVAGDPHLTTDWGFACLVAGEGLTILFDTGANGRVLLHNLQKLGIDPQTIDAVFLSHDHWDHTGGLAALLAVKPQLPVVLPASFSPLFQRDLIDREVPVRLVHDCEELFPGVFSTGPLGEEIPEQGLMIAHRRGPVLITGCAHPGIAMMVDKAAAIFSQPPLLVMGGFHLLSAGPADIERASSSLQRQKVELLAPSHCTGSHALAAFRCAWGDNLLAGGCGVVLEV
ncbi:MAG: MBL fold metallo-hydrolase [Deltaproteobacteria bacterium]|nr:MBL fold metallo-hydrolase [Candidatus Anaeroferrophillus wilburensis]MBN2888568.1 MBL fold metallo-hydrolase [Deltaproteobacteria bacterium]